VIKGEGADVGDTENAELLCRERKRSADYKAAAEEAKARLDTTLKQQRALVQKVGVLERTAGAGGRLSATQRAGNGLGGL